MKIKVIVGSFFLALSISGFTQAVRYPMLKVDAKKELILSSDSTFIDTLILEDKAKLKFVRENNFIYVKNAAIGSSCVFDAAGMNGEKGNQFKPNGLDATHGKNLYIIILSADKLDELTIKTSGGKGGDGAYGDAAGIRNGGDGGRGGNSGSITLYYPVNNFLLTFNNKSKHSIWFKQEPGRGGQGGSGARQSSSGPARISSSTPPDPKVLNTKSYYNSDNPVLGAGAKGVSGTSGNAGELKFLRIE